MSESATPKIESQDLSVGALFKDFYSVPDFQCEYVWQREQVERLLQDLYDEFYDEEGRILSGPEYFLGSIVACKGEDGTFHLIDGQQRMTTIYLILSVIRDMLKASNAAPSKVLDSQIAAAATDPRTFEEVERFRVTLQYEDSEGVLDKIAAGGIDVEAILERTASVRNILSACRDIDEFLTTNLDIREYEIYEWFVTHAAECGIDADPLGFLERLIKCARAHTNFLAYKDAKGNDNHFLRDLSLLGGALSQQYILLLAVRNLPVEPFDRLCQAIENLFFCYIVTREPTKTFERNFARWSVDLRDVKDGHGLDAFIEKYFRPDTESIADRFEFAFRELSQGRIQQYRMRYILAKLTQYIEQQAWGNPAHGHLDHYITTKVEVEHILPSNPRHDVRAAFDKPEEYASNVGRLGNLTLLEKNINSSVSNGSFDEKAPGYRQAAFLLTKSLTENPQVGANTQVNGAVADLIQFKTWDSNAIVQRQEMLAKLARKVWDMPQGEEEAIG